MNDLIIANLEVLQNTAEGFRARAYANAIRSLKQCDHEITCRDDAIKLKGVGKSIADKIAEIIETGELEEVGGEQIKKTQVLGEFKKIWGVGRVKAEELWNAGARTIGEVRQHTRLLTDNQRVGLKYYADLQKRVPRAYVEEIIDKITATTSTNFRVCGSYRRGAKTCGDMDLLLCGDKHTLSGFVERLTTRGVLIEQLGLGPTKYMGITRIHGIAFRIDIEVVLKKEYPFALLYFTGSGKFNESQRTVAKKAGYRLSEHGLFGEDGYVEGLRNERDIFKFLGMEYLEPLERR